MKKNLKRFYIEETHKLLQEEGIEGFTIRKVAERIGCSSSALYKHFSDMEHLLTLAGIRNFRKYSDDVVLVTNSGMNTLDTCIYMWECFLYYAIPNASMIERLFFGLDPEIFQTRMIEYYTEFPEDIMKLSRFFSSIIQNGNLQEREFLILKKAVDEGYLTLENADYLSRIDTYILHGLLIKYKSTCQDEEVCRKAVKEMMDIVRKNYDTYRLK